ncbi:hypothetical protein MHU86_19105 [Fragilaria crotonensis]|nr:hypothetical protein MHU86_19105 [Fragilaria crotonensis]
MPPPPPPSKSYLLVLDTDSEDDDDQKESIRRRSSAARVMLPNNVTREKVEHPNERVYNDDEYNDKDVEADEPTTIIPIHSLTASPEQQQNDASILIPLTQSFQKTNLISPIKSLDQDDINGDSDNDDEKDQDQTQSERLGSSSSSQRSTLQVPSSPSKQLSATNSNDNNVNNKKRRRRRHRGNNKTSATETTTNLNKKKNVTFGTVQIRRFERTLGGDGVPADGGWPLGLGSIIPYDESNGKNMEEPPIPVHEYDERVQQELQQRWRALFPEELEQHLQLPAVLETRQWDYKKERNQKGNSIRNPLFGSLTEDQRSNLLVHGKVLSSKCPPVSSSPANNNNNKKKNSNSSQGRPRANSMEQHSSRNNTSTLTTRSGGTGNNNNNVSRPRSQSIDYFNAGPFDPINVRHIRNELEELRHERSKSDEGCSCRKLQVNSKKMSASKVREELRKRHALPTSTSSPATTTTRLELEDLLRRLVEEEPCCSSQNDCPCVKYGLGCQADACSCWNHRGGEKPKTVMEIKERCRNKFGMYVVDLNTFIGTANPYCVKSSAPRHHD